MGYYNSFVVRIWLDEQGLSRGRIEHVRTHDSLVFGDLSALLGFIQGHLQPPPSYVPPADGDSRDRAPRPGAASDAQRSESIQ